MSVRLLTDDERRQGLGSTDIAAIAGLSPYRTPYDVQLDKLGQAPPQHVTPAMELGTQLEPGITRAYARRRRVRLRLADVVFDPKYGEDRRQPHKWPLLYVHPDRYIEGADPGLLEAKMSVFRLGYGDAGSDDIPPHVAVQVEVQMGLSGRPWVDVALLGGGGLEIYHREANPERFRQLREGALEWWAHHVVERQPVVMEPQEQRDALMARYRGDRSLGPMSLVATDYQLDLIDRYRDAWDAAAAAERAKVALELQVQALMGDHTRLLGPGFSIEWRGESSSEGILSWKAYALALEQVVAGNVAIPPGKTLAEAGAFIKSMHWGDRPRKREESLRATFKTREAIEA